MSVYCSIKRNIIRSTPKYLSTNIILSLNNTSTRFYTFIYGLLLFLFSENRYQKRYTFINLIFLIFNICNYISHFRKSHSECSKIAIILLKVSSTLQQPFTQRCSVFQKIFLRDTGVMLTSISKISIFQEKKPIKKVFFGCSTAIAGQLF